MLFTIRKSQLHVSATKFDHHQVVQMKTCQLAIHVLVGGCIRCRVGSVSARSRKCGGLGFGLVRNLIRTEKLCLLITMSRLGYMTICPNDKCSFVYNILWIKSRRLRVIYTVFYYTLWTSCVHCPLSLLQNIYTSTKLKYCSLPALDIISFGD